MNDTLHACYSVTESGTYDFHGHVPPEKIISIALDIVRDRFSRGDAFSGSSAVKEFVVLQLASLEREVFSCMFLDNRHRLISFDTLFLGTIDRACVHPREVIKQALQYNAAAVIFAHNHPSGNPEPSTSDQTLTARLKEALVLMDIRMLDHIVVGSDGSTVSFAERGLI